MTKTQVKSIKQLIYILFMFTGLIINYIYFNFNIIGVFVVLILAVIFSGIIGLFLPVKSKKRKNQSKKKQPKESKNLVNYPKKAPHNRLLPDDEILKLPVEQLSWREFERLCYLYFKDKGYNPRETKEGADGGVDLIIYDHEHKSDVAIQIKHVKRQITVKDIRELNSAKRNHNCMLAKFITTSTFTKSALIEADKFNVDTHSNNWIQYNIDKWRFK